MLSPVPPSPCLICSTQPCCCSLDPDDECEEVICSSDEEITSTNPVVITPRRYYTTVRDWAIEEAASKNEKTVLKAAWNGDYNKLCKLTLCEKDLQWNLVMCCSSMSGNLESVKHCIANGADDYSLAIEGASEYGRMNVIKYLESKGGRPSLNALSAASTGGYNELIDYFWDLGYKNSNVGLAGASKGGRRSLVDKFLERGAKDVNSALACAAYYGHRELVTLFLSLNATNMDEVISITKEVRPSICRLLERYQSFHRHVENISDTLLRRVYMSFQQESLNPEKKRKMEKIISDGMESMYFKIAKVLDGTTEEPLYYQPTWAHRERKFSVIKRP